MEKKIEKSEDKTHLEGERFSNNNKKVECDKNLPYCLSNTEEKDIKKNSKFIVHKNNHQIKLYDNYFFDDVESKIVEDNNDDINISQNSLVVQRQKHLCS